MVASAALPAATRRRRPAAVLELAPRRRRGLELDTVAARWQLALDAAERALEAAAAVLPHTELEGRRRRLAREREQAEAELRALARLSGIRAVPWLSPMPISPEMLGLPRGTRAGLFDLDDVLTDSALLHVDAWAVAFDEFLLRLADKTGWQFIPFDREADYRAYLDGRLRLEGIHAFLGSRGIRVPEGVPGDSPRADTANGLAARKRDALARGLHQRGVRARAGARLYLEAAAHAGLERAVISASASTLPMLELAGLATLVEARVDADVIRVERLRSRPAPDLVLAACRRLGTQPQDAVSFTHSSAGIAAARAAGVAVIAIGDGAEGVGADRVVPSLGELLDRRLVDGVSRRA
jgi:HAD superfamily hydrolase (TIGR01509 family)